MFFVFASAPSFTARVIPLRPAHLSSVLCANPYCPWTRRFHATHANNTRQPFSNSKYFFLNHLRQLSFCVENEKLPLNCRTFCSSMDVAEFTRFNLSEKIMKFYMGGAITAPEKLRLAADLVTTFETRVLTSDPRAPLTFLEGGNTVAFIWLEEPKIGELSSNKAEVLMSLKEEYHHQGLGRFILALMLYIYAPEVKRLIKLQEEQRSPTFNQFNGSLDHLYATAHPQNLPSLKLIDSFPFDPFFQGFHDKFGKSHSHPKRNRFSGQIKGCHSS